MHALVNTSLALMLFATIITQCTNTKKLARKKMPAASSVRVSCGYMLGGTGLAYGSWCAHRHAQSV